MPDSVERVLFLTHDLTFRGSSILLLRQAQGLEALGIETIVLCTRLQKLEPGLTKHVNVITVPGYGVPLWGRVVGRSVLSQLIDQPPDVIHVHGPAMLSQGLFLGRTLGRPVVLTLTDQTEAARVVLSSGSDVCRAIICVRQPPVIVRFLSTWRMKHRTILTRALTIGPCVSWEVGSHSGTTENHSMRPEHMPA